MLIYHQVFLIIVIIFVLKLFNYLIGSNFDFLNSKQNFIISILIKVFIILDQLFFHFFIIFLILILLILIH